MICHRPSLARRRGFLRKPVSAEVIVTIAFGDWSTHELIRGRFPPTLAPAKDGIIQLPLACEITSVSGLGCGGPGAVLLFAYTSACKRGRQPGPR